MEQSKPRKYELYERLRFRGSPLANLENVITFDQARFTLLTDRLIRLEWSGTGEFEDRSTYAFPNRYGPPVTFTRQMEGKELVLRTGALELRYQPSKKGLENLTITLPLNDKTIRWSPDTRDMGNLHGTRRTLDMCDREASLEAGLLSRQGWTVFDDSASVVFGPDGWVTPRTDHRVQDWYFFGYGHDYKAALGDYARFGGIIPLIPRYVLGAWWSRFWPYSDQDLKDLVNDFEYHDLPLDVLVIDMDWHTPVTWTGYSWNRALFPDPAGFLTWVHTKGLRATLNLHPAQGVQPHEEVYKSFASAMGIDSESGETVHFRAADKQFISHYFELLHHPMEDQGVDFWWLDWQQGEKTEMKGLDPLPWLNHLHYQDSGRRGQRPMLYSRWGGLGNHRYPIGFSGDTFVSWKALQFQPYFTATASNVLFGWWSHDIGGHMGGETEPELYTRWVQFGALSACLRLHSTKDERCERRPWAYPEPVFRAAQEAFHLRYRLIPYLYTMARQATDTGVSLCRPMYYEYPEEEAAYAARNQYFLGDLLIAAPITSSSNPDNGLASVDVWIPEGDWIDYQTKETFTGPRWVKLFGDLMRMPLLVKAGGIIPQAPPFKEQPAPRLASGTTDALPNDRLVLSIFPGKEGNFRLYEDDGRTPGYQSGEYEWTGISTSQEFQCWEVHISEADGYCAALPEERSYEIRLEGSQTPVQVIVDDIETKDWNYHADDMRTVIQVPLRSRRQPVNIRARYSGNPSNLGAEHNRRLALADVRSIQGKQCPEEAEDIPALLNAALQLDTSESHAAIARLGAPFIIIQEFVTPEDAGQQLGRVIVAGPEEMDDPYDLEVNFTLYRAGLKAEQQTIEFLHQAQSKIIPTPFAYDGQMRATRWEAQAKLTWRGRTWITMHQSEFLIPTIHTWQGIYYNPVKEPHLNGRIMDESGRLNPGFPWKVYRQDPSQMQHLAQPYGIDFFDGRREQLEGEETAAAYFGTTILSPELRQARLYYQAEGNFKFYLNGKKIDAEPTEVGDIKGPFSPIFWLRKPRFIPLSLKKGENILVLHTSPTPDEPDLWYFGGVLATPEGNWMPDVIVKE